MEYKDTIDQGATYYKEVVLYADARKTELFSTDGRTPRGSLLNLDRTKAADFSCSWLAQVSTPGQANYLPKRIALVLPGAITTTLVPGRTYKMFVDLDQEDGVSIRALYGDYKVRIGQEPPVEVV